MYSLVVVRVVHLSSGVGYELLESFMDTAIGFADDCVVSRMHTHFYRGSTK